MNAPANIVAPVETEAERAFAAREAAYANAIGVLCPAARTDGTMWIRTRLADMRDAATVGLRKTESPSAAVFLTEITHVAQQFVYAPYPASRLVRILSALSMGMDTARALERDQRNGTPQ